MRILFITGGGSATIYALAPLASAARTAGHEVIVASPRESVHNVVELGLPVACVTDLGIVDALFKDRQGNPLFPGTGEDAEMEFAGRGFARLSASSLDALTSLAEAWQPDLVVGGSHTHAAPLIAHQRGIPFVRQAWDIHERTDVDLAAANDELQPELRAFGLDQIPTSDLFVDTTPPALRPDDAEPAQLMRWVPGNQQVPLEPWMYTKGDRPRVCVTSGSRSLLVPALGASFFRGILECPALADVEVVVATSDQVADELRTQWPDLRGGWLPLDVVAPTCDLVVHHGGGVTAMTVMNAGVPQLVLPVMLASAIPTRRIDEYGASITMASHEEPADDLATACKELLSNPSYPARARDLQQEVAAQPPAAEVVRVMERLT